MNRDMQQDHDYLFQEGRYVMLSSIEESSDPAQIGLMVGPRPSPEREAERFAVARPMPQLPQTALAQQSRMTIAEFVETKFVPEFVEVKALAGRAHYQAILKHVLAPEEVDRMFQVDRLISTRKLKASLDWPYLGHLSLRDTRREHVQSLISAAVARGYSTQTIMHIRSVVSAIFSYARQVRVFTGDNPARLASLPEMVRKKTSSLTIFQARMVLQAMRYPEREMMLLAVLTNMHACEICGLQWKHVNLTGVQSNSDGESIPPLSIAVRKQWYRGESASVKAGRNRMMEIPEILLPVLLRLHGRVRFTGPDDFVLVSNTGTPINAINITARRLNSIGQKLQLPGLSWPMFRRAHRALKAEFGTQFQYQLAIAAD